MQNGTGGKPPNGNGAPPPRELLTASEAAWFLAKFIEGTSNKPSASAIHKMKHRGVFNGFGVVVQMGRSVRYSITGLRKFIQAHTV
jgi:hypothetical protein